MISHEIHFAHFHNLCVDFCLGYTVTFAIPVPFVGNAAVVANWTSGFALEDLKAMSHISKTKPGEFLKYCEGLVSGDLH